MVQIQNAYERDQASGPSPVTTRDQIPLAYEAITDAWLTDILCGAVPGATVAGHRLDAPDNGSTNRRKIAVTYNAAGRAAGLPERLFCKATHDLANRMLLGLMGGSQIETDFYNHIRPRIDIEAPEAYYCAVDPESFNSLVMMRDISPSVVEFCDHRTTVDRARAESQMRLLAKMHGAGYAKADVKAQLRHFTPWPEYFGRTLVFGIKDGSEAGFQDGHEVIPPRLFARAGEIWPGTMKSVERHNVLPQTFAHGDVHLKNWYVAGSGDMGLSDWQCAHLGHWSRDVAYAIATALTPEDRRVQEQELVRLYLDELAANGGPHTTFDEAWLNYRQQLITALTWWTITLHPSPGIPDMQPRDVTLEFVRRIAIAMDDVGTLDALKD